MRLSARSRSLGSLHFAPPPLSLDRGYRSLFLSLGLGRADTSAARVRPAFIYFTCATAVRHCCAPLHRSVPRSVPRLGAQRCQVLRAGPATR